MLLKLSKIPQPWSINMHFVPGFHSDPPRSLRWRLYVRRIALYTKAYSLFLWGLVLKQQPNGNDAVR